MIDLGSMTMEEAREFSDEIGHLENELLSLVLNNHPAKGVVALTSVTTALHMVIGELNSENQKLAEEVGVERGEKMRDWLMSTLKELTKDKDDVE